MLENFIKNRIIHALPFHANAGQEELICRLSRFVVSPEPRKAFLLRGYAGTGKTSIMAAVVKTLKELKQSVVLLAPTGRAAKVLANYAGHSAYTIHKYIYRQKQLGMESFVLSDNMHRHTLFIVDEASMISGQRDNSTFGSGLLLDDLVRYVYSGEGCSMLILGDDAQLPPVGSACSPALDARHMAGYGLHIDTYVLTEVARQALDSGILHNATLLREHMQDMGSEWRWLWSEDFQQLDGRAFIEQLEHSYRDVGEEETILLTRTNRRTNLYNQGIRTRLLWREDALNVGDRVMVSKNNYFWTEEYEALPFLANGDMMDIVRLRHERELYGFRFVDASLRAIDYDWEIDVVLWMDSMLSASPEENQAMQRVLFDRISEDYPELQRNRKKLVEKIYESPYYNALQVRFAYAVTCHKAQGGQWQHVYIDPGVVSEEQRDVNYYRWLYTAITRATNKVYLLKSE